MIWHIWHQNLFYIAYVASESGLYSIYIAYLAAEHYVVRVPPWVDPWQRLGFGFLVVSIHDFVLSVSSLGAVWVRSAGLQARLRALLRLPVPYFHFSA